MLCCCRGAQARTPLAGPDWRCPRRRRQRCRGAAPAARSGARGSLECAGEGGADCRIGSEPRTYTAQVMTTLAAPKPVAAGRLARLAPRARGEPRDGRLSGSVSGDDAGARDAARSFPHPAAAAAPAGGPEVAGPAAPALPRAGRKRRRSGGRAAAAMGGRGGTEEDSDVTDDEAWRAGSPASSGEAPRPRARPHRAGCARQRMRVVAPGPAGGR